MARSVLIATMGTEPGAVTTSVDLLAARTPDPVRIDRLVVLMTPRNETDGAPHAVLSADALCTDDEDRIRDREWGMVQDEFKAQSRYGHQCYYVKQLDFLAPPELEPRVLNIPHDDLTAPNEAFDFLRLCISEILRHKDSTSDEWDVHVSISGGRKSMSAMALQAAIMTGCAANTFQAVVSREVEQEEGEVVKHGADDDAQLERVMHPAIPGDAWLLPVGDAIPWKLQTPGARGWAEHLLNDPESVLDDNGQVESVKLAQEAERRVLASEQMGS